VGNNFLFAIATTIKDSSGKNIAFERDGTLDGTVGGVQPAKTYISGKRRDITLYLRITGIALKKQIPICF